MQELLIGCTYMYIQLCLPCCTSVHKSALTKLSRVPRPRHHANLTWSISDHSLVADTSASFRDQVGCYKQANRSMLHTSLVCTDCNNCQCMLRVKMTNLHHGQQQICMSDESCTELLLAAACNQHGLYCGCACHHATARALSFVQLSNWLCMYLGLWTWRNTLVVLQPFSVSAAALQVAYTSSAMYETAVYISFT